MPGAATFVALVDDWVIGFVRFCSCVTSLGDLDIDLYLSYLQWICLLHCFHLQVVKEWFRWRQGRAGTVKGFLAGKC